LSAAVYAARYDLKTLVLTGTKGGTTAEAHRVANYLGFEDISGAELAQKFIAHAQAAGAQVKMGLVAKIVKGDDGVFSLKAGEETHLARTVVLAVGMKHRRLNLPAEEKFVGKGVSYCFTCDGMFFKGKTVGVVGGGDGAVTAAIYLADICPMVYLIYRGGALKAEPAWLKVLAGKKNIKVIYQTNVVGFLGEEKLTGVVLDKEFQGKKELLLSGLFIEIGEVVDKVFIDQLGLKTDEKGWVIVDEEGKTSVEGVWAAGDITTASNHFRQIVTAAAEGAIASRSIFSYLKEREPK